MLRGCSAWCFGGWKSFDRKNACQRGEWITLGDYRLRISKEFRQLEETREEPQAAADLIVAASEELVSIRALIKVVAGLDEGAIFELSLSECTIGGQGDTVSLADPSVIAGHAKLIVSRGRVMIAELNGPVFLEGTSVRGLTPVFPGESVRLGNTTLEILQKQQAEDPSSIGFGRLVSDDSRMRAVFGRLRRFAAHEAPILIMGESGTGKELAAHGVHGLWATRDPILPSIGDYPGELD